MTNSYLKPHTCTDCGAEFMGGSTAQRCPACRPQHRLRQQLDSQYRRSRGKGRAIGSTSKCEDCGSEYTVTNGPQKYCVECGRKRDAERGRSSRYTTPDGKQRHREATAAWYRNKKAAD